MNDFITPENKHFFVDKEPLLQLLARVNEEMGFVPDPTATPKKAQESMAAHGVRAEDNIFSCGIIAARYEE